tara:strand:+ start:1430 stop:3565 length:2136 start_codon:yes stop_codon:yes gene_type:complete
MKKQKKGFFSNEPFSKKELLDLVLSVFRENSNKNYNYKQVYKLIGVKNPELKSVMIGILVELSKIGSIIEVRPGKYKLFEAVEKKLGVVKSVSLRGVLAITDGGEEVFVNLDYSLFSIIGDRVVVLVYPQKKGRKKGEVLRVLERKKSSFVGVLQKDSSFAFLIPDNKKVPFDIFIPKHEVKKTYFNKKLLVEVVDWSEENNNPVGRIVSVIGPTNNHTAEIHSILYDYDLSPDFDSLVLAASKKIPQNISKIERKKRKDLRNVDTFTIDPDDAKDFDDALSVRKLSDGKWEVGVHIADVSHFVRPGSVLSLEAEKRATSVYLVDRVVPMLPEVISNHICSLKPNEDRLCFSVLFIINEKGLIVDYWIGKTIIHSNNRFTYAQAQEILNCKKGLFSKELLFLNSIAKVLRNKREKKGALTFETSEVKFVLDKNGFPISVYSKSILETNQLIEEFMLLANKTIASFIGNPKKEGNKHSFVYRVHDAPNSDKIASLGCLVKSLGYKINSSSNNSLITSLNTLSSNIKGKSEENMIEKLIIRSMAKAVYSTNNIGHFGLGFDYYTHFTSPIRRYPDLIVHRLLEKHLVDENPVGFECLEEICKHCSEMEKNAAMAERDSIKYMQVKYMKPNLGKTFTGIISGVTEWGLYVELNKTGCEGLVKAKSIKGDFFVYNKEKFALIGMKTKVQYQLGQKVKIKVKSADLDKRQLNFIFV